MIGSVADERLDTNRSSMTHYSVAVGVQNPWTRPRKIELADLVNERWVLPPPASTLGSVAIDAFRISGLDYPRTIVIADPFEVRITLVATGRFISIFSVPH